MLDERFLLIGLFLTAAGTVSYIRSMFRGQAKPNRVTYFLWTLAPFVAFVGEVSEGVGFRVLFTLSVGLNPLAILVFSFILRQAHWDIKPRDYVFGATSIIGLILWLITGEGLLAITFAIIADGMASAPTLIKSFRYPDTEDWKGYGSVIPGALISLLIIDEYSAVNIAYPLYILIVVIALTFLILSKIGPKLLHAESQ